MCWTSCESAPWQASLFCEPLHYARSTLQAVVGSCAVFPPRRSAGKVVRAAPLCQLSATDVAEAHFLSRAEL